VRGFIRAYARVVGADANALVRMYEASPAPEQHPNDGFRTGTSAPRATDGAPNGSNGQRSDAVPPRATARPISRIERYLDPRRKLVPLQPVSERRDAGFRSGYTLLAVVAVGLLVAAWLLVGGKQDDQSVQGRGPIDRSVIDGPIDPILDNRLEGAPAIGAPRDDDPGAIRRRPLSDPPGAGPLEEGATGTEPPAPEPQRRQRRGGNERNQGPATGDGAPDATPRNR
jgi:hypothetical protein